MRLKIDIQIPNWTKWLVGGIAIGVMVGVGVAWAATPAQFVRGEVLDADKMNANFSGLDRRIAALETSIATPQVPPGTVAAFAGTAAPVGWLLCDGHSYDPRTADYAGLFAAIGTVYGGDGVSSFNVPDLQAAGIRGVGTSTKFASNATIGLAQVVDDRFQGHLHSYSVSYKNFTLNSGAYRVDTVDQPADTPISGRVQKAVGEETTNPARTGAETTGKAIGMNYIIKT